MAAGAGPNVGDNHVLFPPFVIAEVYSANLVKSYVRLVDETMFSLNV